jgi:hypothetical protein
MTRSSLARQGHLARSLLRPSPWYVELMELTAIGASWYIGGEVGAILFTAVLLCYVCAAAVHVYRRITR